MAKIYRDNSYTTGGTPLVQLNRITDGGKARILAKIEGRNPSYSVKCRIGASMVSDAENRNILRPGMELVEPTSGNTGIALAFIAAARGYGLTLTMPDNMSEERRKILRAFGAKLELTDANQGMAGAVSAAERLLAGDPEHFLMLQQFKNAANPSIHEHTTGPEIWKDTDGEIGCIVSGVGTGGTITGISRFIKKNRGKAIVSVAVEPDDSQVITQTIAKKPLEPRLHKIQGIGAGFIPEILDLSMVDRVETVTDDEATDYARRLAKEEGILAGISCGAAAAVAVRLGHEEQFSGQTIVVILPDSGERYLSSSLYPSVIT